METAINTFTETCTICEGDKKSTPRGLLFCPHCDVPCKRGANCTICRQGMKGLEDIT